MALGLPDNWGPIGNVFKTSITTPIHTAQKIGQGDFRGAANAALGDTTGYNDAKNGITGVYNDATYESPAEAPKPPATKGKYGTSGLLGGLGKALNDVPGIFSRATGGPVAGADPHAASTPTTPTKGTESGPGILENWFNQRATGTDPGWQYATGRASAEINNRAARSGGYGSSGAQQSINDMFANAITQRQGQLDSLAGGASGEHAGRLGSMFNVGDTLAKNQADTAYGQQDTALAQSQLASAMAQIQLNLSQGKIDQATANQQIADLQKSLGDVTTAAGKYYGDQQGKPPAPEVIKLDTSKDNIPSRYDT